MDDIQQGNGVQGIHRDRLHQPYSLVSSEGNWSLTASHECLEMLVDPFGCNLITCDSPVKDEDKRVQVLIEVADPCQAIDFAYSVDGVLVSDFVTPNYFDPLVSLGVRYSFTGAVKEPLQVLKGVYLSWVDPMTNDWTQQRWYTGDEPTIVPLGPLALINGCWRSQIDAMTGSVGGSSE